MMIRSRKLLRLAGIQVIDAPHGYQVGITLTEWIRLCWSRLQRS